MAAALGLGLARRPVLAGLATGLAASVKLTAGVVGVVHEPPFARDDGGGDLFHCLHLLLPLRGRQGRAGALSLR